MDNNDDWRSIIKQALQRYSWGDSNLDAGSRSNYQENRQQQFERQNLLRQQQDLNREQEEARNSRFIVNDPANRREDTNQSMLPGNYVHRTPLQRNGDLQSVINGNRAFSRVNNIEQHYGTLSQGHLSINPRNFTDLKDTLASAQNSTQSYSTALRGLTSTIKRIRANFSNGIYQSNPKLNINDLHNLRHYQAKGTQAIEYARHHHIINSHNQFNADRQNSNNTSLNSQYNLGRIMPERTSVGTPKLSDYAIGKDKNGNERYNLFGRHVNGQNQKGYAQALKSIGVTPTVFSMFAAQQIRNHQLQQGKNPNQAFNGYATQAQSNAAGRNYTREDRNIAHLSQRAYGIKEMADRVNGYSVTSKGLSYINRRLHDMTNGKGTGFADKALGHLAQYRNNHSDMQSRVRHSIQQLLGNNVVHSNQIFHDENGNTQLNQSALDRVRAVAKDSSNPSSQSAQDYLTYSSASQSLSKTIQSLERFRESIKRATNSVANINRNSTGNPMEGLKQNRTYEIAQTGTLGHFLQTLGMRFSGPAFLGRNLIRGLENVPRTVQQGNSIRMQEQPNIDTQMLGQAINGGAPTYHLDNLIQDRLGQQGTNLGYTGTQMSQFMGSLAPTRSTQYDTMQAANREAEFSRLNGVGPQATGQLFGTLANAGGLGTGSQVSHNTLDLSRQFAGMLHNNHLGGDATQQAQGLNSIFSNMIGSGQTVTPQSAGTISAMQSVLSHGPGGQVFQGQQGAQQLNAFSHGVAGAFSNNLVRNAFASGMPQYGGQQGLYRLQMDMQEPLKHPTQLNNMIQGMSNIVGPAGAEDELTQMGLGPEAAKKVYRQAMSGHLTQGYLDRVKHRNQRTGRSTQRNARKQLEESGNQTVSELRAIKNLISQHNSESGDTLRHMNDRYGLGPMSHHGISSIFGSILGGGMSGGFTLGSMAVPGLAMLAHSHTEPLRPIHNIRGVIRGFRNIPQIAKGYYHGGLKGAVKAYKHAPTVADDIAKASHHGRVARDVAQHPILGRIRRFRLNHNNPNVHIASRLGRNLHGSTLGRVAGFAGRHARLLKGGGRALGLLGTGITAVSDLQGRNQNNKHSKDEGLLGDLAGGVGGSYGGAALGASIGSVVPGLGTAVGGLAGGALGGIAGGSLGHRIGSAFGSLFDHRHTAHAASVHGRRPDYGHENSRARSSKRYTYYWLERINRLLPALAKKMEGFSDVDPSLAGKTGSNGVSNESGTSNGSNAQKAGTNNDVTNGTGAKTINKTGDATANGYAYHAQITPEYTKAEYGNVSNTDDHSNHRDSHNTYNNYVSAPSQDFLAQLAQTAQNAAQYYTHTHRVDWQ